MTTDLNHTIMEYSCSIFTDAIKCLLVVMVALDWYIEMCIYTHKVIRAGCVHCFVNKPEDTKLGIKRLI